MVPIIVITGSKLYIVAQQHTHTMQHLQVTPAESELPDFRDDRRQMIGLYSTAIVNHLSDNYERFIDGTTRKQSTKETYKRLVPNFIAFIQANGINSDSYQDFRNTLEQSKYSATTCNMILSGTSTVLKVAHRKGILPVDITSGVDRFKVSTGHKKEGLTIDETRRLLNYIETIRNKRTRLRIKAIAYLMVFDGLRQFEVNGMRVERTSTKENFAWILRKGKDEPERFNLTRFSSDAICDWIESEGLTDGFLFPTAKGEQMTLRALRKYFTCKKYGLFAKCGIVGKSVHGLRHTNITEVLEAFDGNLNKARKRSGHKGYNMLTVYDDKRTSKQDLSTIESHFERLFF